MASTIEKKEHSQVVISLQANKEEWNGALKKSSVFGYFSMISL